jgi:DNA-binding NarL/FixJ family response regulator
MGEVTRIVLADDHARVRAGIKKLLENQKDMVVIGEAANGIEAVSLVEKLSPDLLLLDMEMPMMDGGQVASYLKRINSSVKVLAVSAYDDLHYINGMLQNGAAGYLTKEEVPDILIQAIRKIVRGENGWISRRAARKITEQKTS